MDEWIMKQRQAVVLSVLSLCVCMCRDCGTEQGTCEDEAKIMYAWARNAPPTKLPKGDVCV